MVTATTTLTEPFQWSETTPGRWERDLDEREEQVLVYTRSAPGLGLYYGTSTMCFKYDVEDLPERVKQAWRTLRFDHPSLGSKVESTTTDNKMVYQVPSDAEVDAWVSETFTIDESGRSADELYSEFDTSMMTTLRFLPQTQEVLFGIDHVLCDGTGILMLLNNLCELIVTPRAVKFGDGSEVGNLSLPFSAVLDVPKASPAVWEQARNIVEAWGVKMANAMSLSTKDLTARPGACRKMTMLFAEEDTAKLQSAAKEKGLTLGVAAHAALVIASKKHGGANNDGKNWGSALVFGYRHKARPPYNTPKYPISVLSVGFPEAIETPEDFMDAAGKLKEAYKFWLTSEEAVMMVEPLRQLVSEAMKKASGRGRIPVANASNLGEIKDVKERYGKLEVISLSGGMREIGPSVNNHFYTFKRRLGVLANYNAAYHDESSIEKLLEMTKTELLKGLGLD